MSQWWTYRPEDFLLFSERVYWRLFELHNAAVWPWPVVALVLGATIAALILFPTQHSDRLISTILATGWLFVAWTFFWNRHQTINWAAPYIAPFFAFEAVLLVLIGGIRNALLFRAARDPGVILGLALYAYALAIHPLTALLGGRPVQAAEIFAIAPDPTAIATLGLVAAAKAGASRWLLLPVPILWCVLSWATLQTMGTWEAWLPLVSAICGIVACLLSRNYARKRPGDTQGAARAE